MRKFPKLLAVVLAIAIVICPAMCLTTMADTSNGYSVSYNETNKVLTVEITSATGFMVSFLTIDIDGYVVDDENVTVVTQEGYEFAANADYQDGVLKLLVAAKEASDIHLVTKATVSVPAEEDPAAERYYIALTNIQAADAGTAETPESFLEFAGVAEDGAVENVVPTVDKLPHECDVVEYIDNGDGTHNGVCDCADATVLIENEDHADEDFDGACDFCDAVLEVPHECDVVNYVDNGDGTHNGVCDCADATVLIENEDHADENADNVCDYCDADIEVAVEYSLTHSSATISGLASAITFGFKYSGISFSDIDAIEDFGVLVQCVDYYDEATGVTIDGTKVIKAPVSYTANTTIRITNIPLANFGKDYVFVLYVKTNDGVYTYGSEERLSYAEDYLLPRKTAGVTVGTTTVTAAVAARANAYLGAYYELTGDAAYAEFAVAALDQNKTYTSTIAKKTYTNINADSRLTYTSAAVSGLASATTFGFKYSGISFSGSEEITEFGLLVQCADYYDEATGVTIDGTKVIKAPVNYTANTTIRITNIPLANFGKDYVFVLYVKLSDGTYAYSQAESINYVGDFLVPRIVNNTAKTTTRAIAYIKAYEQLVGTTVYSVS